MSKNTKSVEEMTLEEVRDEIAELQGWVYDGDLWLRGENNAEVETTHPVPESLDTVAALMPEGWIVSLNQWRRPVPWTALATSNEHNGISDAVKSSGDTELLARFRLLLLILRKESNV